MYSSYPGSSSRTVGPLAVFLDYSPGAGIRHFFYSLPKVQDTSAAVRHAKDHQQTKSVHIQDSSKDTSYSQQQMRAAAHINHQSKQLVASLDERGVGYCREYPETRPLLPPQQRSSALTALSNPNNTTKASPSSAHLICNDFIPTPNQLHLCAACSHKDIEHIQGRCLSLTIDGGCLTDEYGNRKYTWLWDTKRQNAGTPPPGQVIMRLSSCLSLIYTDRHDIIVSFDCENIHRKMHCGNNLKVRESYDLTAQRSLLQRGKFDLYLPNRPSLAARTDTIISATTVQKETLDHLIDQVGLGEMMHTLSTVNKESKQRTRALATGTAKGALDLTGRSTHLQLHNTNANLLNSSIRLDLYADPREAAKEATRRETPMFNQAPTDALLQTIRNNQNNDVLNNTLNSVSSSGKAGGGLDSTLASSTTRTSTGGKLGILEHIENTLSGISSLRSDNGYGTLSGAAMHNGKWLTGVDTLRKLQRIHPPSKKSFVLRNASGKYESKNHLVHDVRDTFFRTLDEIKGDELTSYLTTEARPDQAVLIAMLHPSESLCRRIRQLLEHVNGTLAAAFPDDPQFENALEDLTGTSSSSSSSSPSRSGNTQIKLCPFRIAAYDMAAPSPTLIRKYTVKSLPTFLLFFNNKLVYVGPMGGVTVVGLPTSQRPVNTLIADPNALDQAMAEKYLKRERFPYDIACGTFRKETGRIEGTCDAAVHLINRLSSHASEVRRRQASMREEKRSTSNNNNNAGKDSTPSPTSAPGTDATSQTLPDYAIVLLDANCGDTGEVTKVASAMGAASLARTPSGTGLSSSSVSTGTSMVKLVGRSLLVACWPLGSIKAHTNMCEMCMSIIHHNASSRSSKEAYPSYEYSCPHCGIIYNASYERLLQGKASIAMVKSFKAGTLPALANYWRLLDNRLGNANSGQYDTATLLTEAGANTADPRVSHALSHIPLVGNTVSEKGGILIDDVHLGLTHNDILYRLLDGLRKGRANQVLPDNFKPPLGVAISETTVRGVPLTL